MNFDPTHSKLLETAHEAFENGGESLESLSGSITGVYVGNILFEHYMMHLRDADFTLPYLTTGGSPTMLSNRVNYVFNLKGPRYAN
jgi:acyl transferase domain-containing protein